MKKRPRRPGPHLIRITLVPIRAGRDLIVQAEADRRPRRTTDYAKTLSQRLVPGVAESAESITGALMDSGFELMSAIYSRVGATQQRAA